MTANHQSTKETVQQSVWQDQPGPSAAATSRPRLRVPDARLPRTRHSQHRRHRPRRSSSATGMKSAASAKRSAEKDSDASGRITCGFGFRPFLGVDGNSKSRRKGACLSPFVKLRYTHDQKLQAPRYSGFFPDRLQSGYSATSRRTYCPSAKAP